MQPNILGILSLAYIAAGFFLSFFVDWNHHEYGYEHLKFDFTSYLTFLHRFKSVFI